MTQMQQHVCVTVCVLRVCMFACFHLHRWFVSQPGLQ